jgi:hypothetical protein
MHRGVDLAGEQRRVDLLGEQALAAEIGERPILDDVAAGADDQSRDAGLLPAVRCRDQSSRLAGLGEGEGEPRAPRVKKGLEAMRAPLREKEREG